MAATGVSAGLAAWLGASGSEHPGDIAKPAVSTKEPALHPRRSTGFVFHEDYLRHDVGAGHPESPARLEWLLHRLRVTGLERELRRIEPAGDPEPAIRSLHGEAHVARVDEEASDPAVCRKAVAGVLSAVNAVCLGEVRNAFSAIRPPGHHATDTGPYGFCYFGNVAVAARHAREVHGLERILIVDWDYHHGNGTEWAFYNDPSVLFFSTHDVGAFPGTGLPERTGVGPGRGYNINVPLSRGAGDRAILGAFETRLLPAAERFRPELVLISAGFDARKDDTLGKFEVTDEGFARLTRLVMHIAETHAGSRVVSVLEGGYNPDGLARAVEAHIAELLS